MKSTNHIVYFDLLRVIAIFAVIILHISGLGFNGMDVFGPVWEMSNLWAGSVRWGVPVFVMISGALFLDPSRAITIHKLYTKSIPRLLGIFVFWSVCYTVMNVVFGSNRESAWTLVSHVILGHFHLWFLWMLMGLYVLVPLLRPICINKQLTRYFLLLCFVFSFLFPTVSKVLTGLSVSWPDGSYSTVLDSFSVLLNDKIHFHFTLDYVAYFVLGYYVNQTEFLPWQRKLIYGLGVVGWLFSIYFTRFVSQHIHNTFDFYSGSNVTLYVLAETLAVFVWAKYTTPYLSARAVNWLGKLAQYVLGIYVLHAGVQACLMKLFNLSVIVGNPFVSIPLSGLAVFVLSLGSSMSIKRITKLSKYIM